jgi:glycosyltransferase involved in cell wall biosynthesis
VIIPARDAEHTLPRTLSALAAQERISGFEVIVVDNGSRDETAALAEHAPVVSRVVRRRRGGGAGSARNAGVAVAASSTIAFIDADCSPAPRWLEMGTAALAYADLVQGRVLPDPLARLGPFDRTLQVDGAYGLFESANLFVRRELFDRLGGFPDGLETGEPGAGRGGAPFGEDAIFGWRAKRIGARTSFCQAALAYHEVFPRGPAGFVAERARYALFPALAAAAPELRESFFHRRYFLSRRSAGFDMALAAGALALVSSSPLLLLGGLPYLRMASRSAREWGLGRAPLVFATEALADAVGAVWLVRGSIGSRSLLV